MSVGKNADRAGEKIWQLPLFEDYKEQLKSEIADMLNSPGRPAEDETAVDHRHSSGLFERHRVGGALEFVGGELGVDVGF